MEKIDSINSDRIKWCCTDRGITPEDLATDLNFSWDRFQTILNRGSGLTFNQLRKIAEYFNRGILFFLETGSVSPDLAHTPQFRTIANQKTTVSPKLRKIVKQVESHRDIYLSLREQLDSYDTPYFSPPQFPARGPKHVAQFTRKWLDLPPANNFSTYRTAVESKGILVFRSNGYNGAWQIPKEDPICGFTIYSEDCPVIVVKKEASASRQAFTMMHELGHILLHKNSFIDDDDDLHSYTGKEAAANAFAGCLLVPDQYLKLIDTRDRPTDAQEYDDWLMPFTTSWGVSTEVILRRLLDNDRLTEDDYHRYRSWRMKQPIPETPGGSRKFRYREPKHIFGDTFVSTVIDALHERKITLAKASTYLDNLKISDLHKLEGLYGHS